MSNVLLIRPSYPSSRNNVYRIPIGLCKLSSYHKSLNDNVWYTEGTVLDGNIPYDKIDICHVTTLFTYWSSISIEAINFYKKLCPNAKIITGGIYASIAPDHIKANSMVDEVIVGVVPNAEGLYPNYSILPTDDETINNTQIIWTSRGCERRCSWCYTHVIEPSVYFKDIADVEDELITNKERKNVILYDNSFLQNQNLPAYLNMFVELHKKYKFKFGACQGIDGRMMKKWEESGVPVAELMKKSGFYDLRFSYDHRGEQESVYYCVDKFLKAGYKSKDMQIFVIINNIDSPDIIEQRYWDIYSKLKCQIHSDRMRPADWFYDNYHKGSTDYFINTEHEWTNDNIRGTLSFMSDLNYATRMGILYTTVERAQKASVLNKGKSSHKFSEYL